MRSEIIVCGRRYDIDHPVVTFEDSAGFSAYIPHRSDEVGQIYASDPAPGLERRATRYRQRRTMGHSDDLQRLRQVVRQVTVHLDGCRDAAMCYQVLHNQRGLSVHFMVDNDGTIYQTLDVLHCAFHAAGVNEVAVGIELQNRGDAARNPNFYGDARGTLTCWVHGHQFLCYTFTDAQYRAMVQLSRALARILDVPLAVPRSGGDQVWTRIDGVREFRGFLGHYHVSLNKWDPGPFDFHRLFSAMGARLTFPLTRPPTAVTDEDPRRLQLRAERYFESSETETHAHFPLGPLGRSRLWHGGVHLPTPAGRRVYAIAEGRVVAARLGPSCPVGSCNFVLLRHRLALQSGPVTFFSLYYHLAWPNTDTAGQPIAVDWLEEGAGSPWAVALERGEVTAVDAEVDAGAVIGTVGEAGPPGYREGQIHFAVFAAEELASSVDPGYWEVVESDGRRRLCEDPRLLRPIDRRRGSEPPDGRLSFRELRNFFQLSELREDLRRVVVRHRSEWTPGDWNEELDRAPDFAELPAARRRRMIARQIKPTLWWTPRIAQDAGLPADGVIYSYHPIGFVLWLDDVLKRSAAQRSASIASAEAWQGKLAPEHLTVDRESAAGTTDHEDYYSGELGKELTLEDLVDGYPD